MYADQQVKENAFSSVTIVFSFVFGLAGCFFWLALLCKHRTVAADHCSLVVSFLEKASNNALVKVFLPDQNDMNTAKQSRDCLSTLEELERREDPFRHSANSQKS
jgi:hypothetical protein